MATVRSNFVVPNAFGLHARPSALFAKTAGRYKACVRVKNGDRVVDGKSILELLMIGATQGSRLTVVAEGYDADAAMKDIQNLFATAFGEQ
ncbi:MAG: HPr family phosphocarrier protein [Kiritimatiellae bacterium]|nr:HPr family phosphocarrier protein [Kiritimatiellia bacterium]